MKRLFLLLCVSILFCVQQRSWAGPEVLASPVVRSNNAFAIALYQQLAQQEGGFVCAPVSVATGLWMLSDGAKGNTSREMAAVLHRSNESTNFHAAYAAFLQQLESINTPGITFYNARSVWTQRDYPFIASFQEHLRHSYNASLNPIDLTGWPNFDPEVAGKARAVINEWAKTHTGGLITETLPPTLPSPETRLLLIDATYFKGLWAVPFDSKRTETNLFRLNENKSVSVPMMHVRGGFLYHKSEDFEAVRLPYLSNRLSMLILLPKAVNGLIKLERDLGIPRYMQRLSGNLRINMILTQIEQIYLLSCWDSLELALPKFSESSSLSLNQPLMNMGMRDAFEEGHADFSGITPKKPFFINTVLQKARLTVNEQGTEAAAATEIDLTDSAPKDSQFVADHPFVFLIHDDLTGAILLIGRVCDPSKE